MIVRPVAVVLSMTLMAALAGACGGDPTEDQTANPNPTNPTSVPAPTGVPSPAVAETVATGLITPWGLAFLPDGAALVSERNTGRIKRIAPGGGRASTVGDVPGVAAAGEGGLMGLAVARDFAAAPYVYAYFTAREDNRIVRMRYENGRLGDPEVILDGIPKGINHDGGRIAFGPDGKLYAGTGEAGQEELSQDRDSLGGKILRINPDGTIPADNPLQGSPVYSYGHRNVQGLAFDDQGQLWAAEFGQNRWDELNLIRQGDNYGWPEVEGQSSREEFVNPLAQWATDEASPSAIAIAGNAVWMAGLRGQRLWRIPLLGQRVGEPAPFFVEEYGRLRTVAVAPDGSLWLTTSNTDGRAPAGYPKPGDDRILRVTLS